jgi:predicted nuclease of predicted toxin-antitoxin system
MKLLLDQNISYRLVNKIEPLFPGTEQVKRMGLESKPDKLIWDFARKEGFASVTFDSDFYDMSLLYGHPPKLIWIRSGNTTSNSIERILKARAMQIKNFISDSELSCLEIID